LGVFSENEKTQDSQVLSTLNERKSLSFSI